MAGLAFKKNENVDMEIWMTAGSHCTFVVALACPAMQILGILKTLGKELFPKRQRFSLEDITLFGSRSELCQIKIPM